MLVTGQTSFLTFRNGGLSYGYGRVRLHISHLLRCHRVGPVAPPDGGRRVVQGARAGPILLAAPALGGAHLRCSHLPLVDDVEPALAPRLEFLCLPANSFRPGAPLRGSRAPDSETRAWQLARHERVFLPESSRVLLGQCRLYSLDGHGELAADGPHVTCARYGRFCGVVRFALLISPREGQAFSCSRWHIGRTTVRIIHSLVWAALGWHMKIMTARQVTRQLS